MKKLSVLVLPFLINMANASSIDESLVAYHDAWLETDADKRALLLQQAVTEDILFIDPDSVAAQYQIDSREKLNLWINQFQVNMMAWGLWPLQSDKTTNVDIMGEQMQEQHFRFDWQITAGDFQIAKGLDVGKTNTDGKITHMTTFFNDLIPRCQAPVWREDTVYLVNDQVTLNGVEYQANWWVNISPEAQPNKGEWTKLRSCYQVSS